jgi:hypothetical protein
MDAAVFFAENGVLKPVPGQSRETAMPLLLNATQALSKAVTELQGNAKQGNKITPEMIRQAADATGQLVTAASPVAATLTSNPEVQKKFLGTARDLVDSAIAVVALSRAAAPDHTSAPKIQNLDKGVKNFQAVLGSLQQQAKAVDGGEVDKALSTFS